MKSFSYQTLKDFSSESSGPPIFWILSKLYNLYYDNNKKYTYPYNATKDNGLFPTNAYHVCNIKNNC